MAISIKAPVQLGSKSINQKQKSNIPDIWEPIAAIGAENRASWFIISLIAQSLLFLPLPAILMFYYHEPVNVLVITFVLFFANVISEMKGPVARTIISLFALVVVDLFMLAVFLM